MIVEEMKMIELMDGSDKYFSIPIYQRRYEWDSKDCETLFNDILNIKQNEHYIPHFIGTIITKRNNNDDKEHVIDGQQRILTFHILVKSFVDFIINNKIDFDESDIKKIIDTVLINPYKKIPKLNIIVGEDSTYYYNLITNKKNITDNNFDKNYNTFYNLFDKEFKKLNDNDEIIDFFENFYLLMKKLAFVKIKITESDENPNKIFESINSSGKKLNETDKIKNLLFLNESTSKQKEIYENFWEKIESDCGDDIENFFYNYLFIKNLKPKRANIYFNFKYLLEYNNKILLLEEIIKYSSIYNNFINRTFENNEINSLLYEISTYKLDSINNIFMKILYDYNYSIISLDKTIIILKLINNYLFRRSLLNINNKGIATTFDTLRKILSNEKYVSNEDDYVEQIIRYLTTNNMSDSEIFINDIELEEKLKTQNVTKTHSILKYCFSKIEKYYGSRKEINNFDNFTIEHIMPQTLSNMWKTELGENYETISSKYLQKLGNLTLIAHNSELGNMSYSEKKLNNDGYINSRLNINSYFDKINNWNDVEIQKRTIYLFNIIKDIWSYPTEEVAEIIKYNKLEFENIEYFSDIILNLNGRKYIDENDYEYWINYYEKQLQVLNKNPEKYYNGLISDAVEHTSDILVGESINDIVERYKKRLKVINKIYKKLYKK